MYGTGSDWMNEQEFNNGLAIHNALKTHYKSVKIEKKDKINGIYGLFSKNQNETDEYSALYFGQYEKPNKSIATSLKRVLHYPWIINRVFESGNLKIVEKGTVHMYYPMFRKLIETDIPLKYITIQDMGYDPKLIEASIEIAEVVSNRSLFPHVVNRKFEHCIDNHNLRYIFQYGYGRFC